jgi:hypothetical protein
MSENQAKLIDVSVMVFNATFNNMSAKSCIAWVFYSPGCFLWDSAPQVHSMVSNVNFVLWGEGGLQKYALYAQMSIQCVEYAFTVSNIILIGR